MSSSSRLPEIYRERILDILCEERQLSFAILSPELKVIQASKNFNEFQSESDVETIGTHICNLFWELVGNEPSLDKLLSGESELFRLEKIVREFEDGSTTYLSLIIFPLDKKKLGQGLLLIIENTSLASTLEQQMVQDRNELRLTKINLSNANKELSKLNRLKSLFLSIAAHDMRSPLTAIRGYTELAVKAQPVESSSKAKEYLSIVISLADTLSRLITDFLSIDIIEQGKLKIKLQTCNLNALVKEVSEVMGEVARRKSISLETHLDASIPEASIHADPERIRQILFNLISNAIKYTRENDSVIIDTRLESTHVIVSVTDHGPGIPEADIPKLFDLYHRTDSAQESKIQGLGLGLFIVKSLVDAHNGKIGITSELDIGTVFTVKLPLFQGEEQ